MSNNSNSPRITRRTFLEASGAAAMASPLSAFAASSQAAKPSSLKIEKNVVIGKGGQTDLHCDIYNPPSGTGKRMAIIHLHGGGFARGNKEALAEQVAPITALGYVSIATQYRLTDGAKWPAQIEDVKTAIRWARVNAGRLGIDPKRIAIAGHSAGGHLALFAAGTANRAEFEGSGGNPKAGTELAACLAFYPAIDVHPYGLLAPGSSEAAFRAVTPTTYMDKAFAPTIIFHGLADVTVAPESSQQVLKLLRDAGVPSELHEFAGVPHEFDQHPEFAESCAQLTTLFLDRYVLNPRTYPPFTPGGARR